MWQYVILTYHINTSSEILTHSKRLRLPQAKGQKMQDWWKSVLSATQYLQSAGRPTSLVDLGDIVKGGTLNIHYAWTKDIYSGITTEAQIHAMIYTFGIHIETKLLNDEIKLESEGTGLPATSDLSAKVRLLEEQLVALLAIGASKEGSLGTKRKTRRTRTRTRTRRKRTRHKDVLRMREEEAYSTRLPGRNCR